MGKFVFVSLVFAACALAVDCTGRWWGDAVIDGQTQPVYVTLVQEGTALRGSGGPTKGDQDLLAGKVVGSRIVFDIVPNRRTPLHFELSPDGDWLRGTIRVQHNGQTVTGKVSIRRRTD
jgi:hypothetical protein